MPKLTRKEIKRRLLIGESLAGLDLTRLNLRSFDFSEVDLTNTDFRDSSLLGANFENACLEGAMFSHIIINEKKQKNRLKIVANALVNYPNSIRSIWDNTSKKPSFIDFIINSFENEESIVLKALYGEENAALFLVGSKAADAFYEDARAIMRWLKNYQD